MIYKNLIASPETKEEENNLEGLDNLGEASRVSQNSNSTDELKIIEGLKTVADGLQQLQSTKPTPHSHKTGLCIGDKVTVIADNCFHGYIIGKTLTIKNLKTYRGAYQEYEVTEGPAYVQENDVQLTIPASIPTPGGATPSGNTIKIQSMHLMSDIKMHRKMQGLSQRALANKAGMSQGTITRAENNLWCSLRTIMRIAEALGKTLSIK